MSQDLYEGIAERYDLFHGEFGTHDPVLVDFFRQLFAQHQVQSVLDCACGTGQHLALFHSLDCEVIGADISDAMLAQARKNLAEYGIEIPLHQADYCELPHHFDRQFDAVVCLSSAILHMPTKEQVIRAFESMRDVLRKGGILVLTQGTTDKQWQEKPRFILAINDRDFTRLFVIDYKDQGARYNILDIHHTAKIRDFKVWGTEYKIYLRDDQEKLLQASDFEIIDFYANYHFEPYKKQTSNRLITVAQK